jgi:hypothetical protein
MQKTACTLSAPAIGYHIIVESIRVAEFLASLESTEISRRIQQRVDYLNRNNELCMNWRGKGQEQSGQTKSLIEIFDRFRIAVDDIHQRQVTLCNNSLEPLVMCVVM